MDNIKKTIEDFKDTRVAIVHDWLITFGGGERVVSLWKEIFPEAPIHTLIYDSKSLSEIFPPDSVITSRMQKLPGVKHYYRKLLSLMPRAFEEFDLSSYDMVLSSSSSCAKGVLTSSSTYHASYVHSPMRYAWDLYPEYLRNSNPVTRFAMRRMMSDIRLWDLASANRVDQFLCNSREVARRIRKVYRRDSIVVHPPIETGFFTPEKSDATQRSGSDLGERFLIVGRLTAYKRIDIAIEACNRMSRPLDIIGDGPERRRLQSIAGPTIRFLGFQNDTAIRDAYRKCRAFLFPGFEDFGMTPLEAQSCGKPVIAFGKGGALETVVNEETGLFFEDQTGSSLMHTMEDFESRLWDTNRIRNHAEGFGREQHISRLLTSLSKGYRNFNVG